MNRYFVVDTYWFEAAELSVACFSHDDNNDNHYDEEKDAHSYDG